jgi:hypothetical protein
MFDKPVIILAAALGCLSVAISSPAQVASTSLVTPATKLESLETNICSVIFRATTELGSIPANTGVLQVRCTEITDTSTGHKEQGMAMKITQKNQAEDKLLIDYDEIASLSTAINYLTKLDISMTPLNTFDASYSTKSGFRVAALGSRRTGAIQFSVRDARFGGAPLVFSRQQLAQLESLVDQAKSTLDSLRGG